jgi:transcriptional regulator GlxA family with amidase domain
VVIVALPLARMLDVFGPAEVFHDASRIHGGRPAYHLDVVSAGGARAVQSHVGTRLDADRSYREASGPVDTLLVAGGLGAREQRCSRDFLDWLRDQAARARRFGSICTGAWVLAEAGLLDGRRATTHWGSCGELARRYPRVTVDPDPIYVRDGNCFTSAGVTAGIDLALALSRRTSGARWPCGSRSCWWCSCGAPAGRRSSARPWRRRRASAGRSAIWSRGWPTTCAGTSR